MRDFFVAQHEAAHIVVGLTVGLRVRRAVLHETPAHGTFTEYGAVWFNDRHASATQQGLAFAAGSAWDRCVAAPRPKGYDWVDGDADVLRAMGYTRKEIGALVTASLAILTARMPVHARVARALYDRDLQAADVARLMQGEPLD
jgi:hypothetical protein